MTKDDIIGDISKFLEGQGFYAERLLHFARPSGIVAPEILYLTSLSETLLSGVLNESNPRGDRPHDFGTVYLNSTGADARIKERWVYEVPENLGDRATQLATSLAEQFKVNVDVRVLKKGDRRFDAEYFERCNLGR